MASTPVSALELSSPRDCDNNAVINCGALSTIELKRKYRENDYAQKVFASFSISSRDIQAIGSTASVGKVTQKGNVYVQGQDKPVATNAMTAGRQDIPGSAPVTTGGITYYKRPPSVSFNQASLPALVVVKNGEFQYAIIASCGNPVSATPVRKAITHSPAAPPPQPTPAQPAPAPQAAPTQTQTQSQSQQVVIQQAAAEKPAPKAVAQETSLPNVGAASTASIFILTIVTATYGFRRWLLNLR